MNEQLVTKRAAVQPAETENPNGAFSLILSTPAEDRDGEKVKSDEWVTPLPDFITFDVDHGMSVQSTVGSGAPSIDDAGNLVVDGTYASTPLAQETRALVNEGHIRTASVAFLRKTNKDEKGAKTVTRELLNGAFVAVPANPEAKILMSKALVAAKEGRRNASNDQQRVQAMHDTSVELGAACAKALAAADTPTDDADDDPEALISAVDAALDEATDLFATVDPDTLPPDVAQAIALVTAAEQAIDQLLEVLGINDPDDPEDMNEPDAPGKSAARATQSPASRASAPVAAEKVAPAADPDPTLALSRLVAITAAATPNPT